MWLCVLRAVELKSPWCTPSQHQKDLEESSKTALRRRHEDSERPSDRHGPSQKEGAEHQRARFMMI